MDIRKMKAAVIDALEEIKAKSIVMLNVSKLTSLFDYLVVASGDSNRQTRALADNVKERLKQAGATVYGTEGEENGEWVLVDLGDIVVHVMVPATRDYYRLEDLWREGKLEFPKPQARKTTPAKPGKPSAKEAMSKAGSKPKTGSRAKTGTGSKTGTRVRTGIKVKTRTAAKTGTGSRVGAKAKTATAGRTKTGAGGKTRSVKVKTGSSGKAASRTGTTARVKAAPSGARRKKAA